MAIIQCIPSAVDSLCQAAAVLVAGAIQAREARVANSCLAAGHLTLSSLGDLNKTARAAFRKWLKESRRPRHPDFDAGWDGAR